MVGSRTSALIGGTLVLAGQIVVLHDIVPIPNDRILYIVLGYIIVGLVGYFYGRDQADNEKMAMGKHMMMMSSLIALMSEVLYRNGDLEDRAKEVDEIVEQYGGMDPDNASQIVREQVQDEAFQELKKKADADEVNRP